MKKIFLLSLVFVLLFYKNNYSDAIIPQQHMEYLEYYCEHYNIEKEMALAILLVENPSLDPNAIHYNNDGTIDHGYFQINSIALDEIIKYCKCSDIMDPKQNIQSAIYLLNKAKAQLIKWDIPITHFNLAVMYHRPADMKKIWNGKTGTSGEIYAHKVFFKYQEIIR